MILTKVRAHILRMNGWWCGRHTTIGKEEKLQANRKIPILKRTEGETKKGRVENPRESTYIVIVCHLTENTGSMTCCWQPLPLAEGYAITIGVTAHMVFTYESSIVPLLFLLIFYLHYFVCVYCLLSRQCHSHFLHLHFSIIELRIFCVLPGDNVCSSSYPLMLKFIRLLALQFCMCRWIQLIHWNGKCHIRSSHGCCLHTHWSQQTVVIVCEDAMYANYIRMRR